LIHLSKHKSLLYPPYAALRAAIQGDTPPWIREISLKAKKELPGLREKSPKLDEDGRKLILFWEMSPWEYTVIDCILATALRLRGHETLMITCDGLEFCEMEQVGASNKNCRSCAKNAQRYFRAFQLESKPISEFIDEKARLSALEHSRGPLSSLRSLVYKGISVGELAQVNVGYYNGLPATLWDRQDHALFQKACEAGVLFTEASSRIIEETKPDVVVTAGGRSITWAPIFQLAESKGLITVNWEDLSLHKNGFVFSHSQPAINMALDDVWPTEKQNKLTEEQRKEVADFFLSWRNGKATPYRYYDHPNESPDAIKSELGLGRYGRVVSAFPNILREDNRIKGNAAFANQIEWLRALIALARGDPGTAYVVRSHPAESRLPMDYILNRLDDMIREYEKSIPDNLILIPSESEISSYKLAELSDVLIVWTGTLGMEFALSGRRVLVVGDPGYRGKGFTTDVADGVDMAGAIGLASEDKQLSKGEIDLAERYAYISRFRALMRFPYHVSHSDRRFVIPSFRELAAGGNAELDKLCRCVIEDKPFLDL